MAHVIKIYLLIVFLLSLWLVNTSHGFCVNTNWKIRFINGIKSSRIIVHPTTSDGRDFGIQHLRPFESYIWQFCDDFRRSTSYYATFVWPPHVKNYTVLDRTIEQQCPRSQGSGVCFWAVREDGLYVNSNFDPFPVGWVKKYDW
ncbi:putative plant self-incompatibility S1 [Helianthus anomalus]